MPKQLLARSCPEPPPGGECSVAEKTVRLGLAVNKALLEKNSEKLLQAVAAFMNAHELKVRPDIRAQIPII